MGPEKGNLNEFKSITAVSGRIQLVFQDKGGRFNYQIGDGERKVSAYGESIEVLNNQRAQFATKGLKITFTPVAGSSGSFIVNKEMDFRSMGGGVSKEVFIISAVADAIVYGNKTAIP